MALTAGEMLNNRYKIIKAIGSGGMAEVYLAKDMLLDREVAIKMLRSQFQTDQDLLAQFQREAKSAARLIHPNIINIYDVISSAKDQYIVMEYVDGITLKRYMEEHKLTLSNVLDITMRLAEGLQHAHSRNVVHCDIKPLNILIDKNLNPKIADFGIAKVVSSQTMVYTTSIMGSVHYISPEQASGGKVTYLSDIYSLGIVMFEMLTGHVPFNGATAVAVAMMHTEKPVPRLSEYMEQVPEGLQEIIDKMLAKRPEERYQSALELRQDLARLRQQINPESAELPLTTNVGEGAAFAATGKARFENTDTVVMHPVRPAKTEEQFADTVIIKSGKVINETEVSKPRLEDEVKEALDKLEKAEQEEEKERKMTKKRKINYTRLMLVVTAFVVVISVIGHFIFSGPQKVVEVPNVVNMTVVDAQKKLEGLKLKVELEEQFGDKDKFKPGTVMEQSVKPGEKRKEGSLIILKISKGAELKGVPDVKGMSLAKAQNILEEVGFKVGKVEKRYEKGVSIGTVLEQSPAATGKAPKGSGITLVVCEGDKEVPNLVGKNQADAESILKAVGLTLGNVNTVGNSTEKKGVIVACNPNAGARLGEGDKVDITISDGSGAPASGSTYVDFAIPGTKMCNVVITVSDSKGKRVLVSGMKKGGTRIRQRVETNGTAKATLTVDGQVVEERSL